MNAGGAFLIFVGIVIVSQVTYGHAVARLNLFG